MEATNSCYFQFEVPPLGRKNIRHFADSVRQCVGYTMTAYVDICKVLEILSIAEICEHKIVALKDWREGNDKHAFYNIEENKIFIREDVYGNASHGSGRDRFTIAHEIGHALLLEKDSVKFFRGERGQKLVTWKDPEWQASCFAGEFLISAKLCADMSVDEIVENCGVSLDAAAFQKNRM